MRFIQRSLPDSGVDVLQGLALRKGRPGQVGWRTRSRIEAQKRSRSLGALKMVRVVIREIGSWAYRKLYGVRGAVRHGRNFHLGLWSIVWAPHSMQIGDAVYIGKMCTVECDGEIGNGVMLANNVGLIGRYDHDYRRIGKWIRYAPWIGDPEYAGPGRGSRIVIEDDVWVGYGATVLSGICVGRGAIVAAGSVVTKDVRAYDIVAGNPARPIGRRFTDEEIVKHEQLVQGMAS